MDRVIGIMMEASTTPIMTRLQEIPSLKSLSEIGLLIEAICSGVNWFALLVALLFSSGSGLRRTKGSGADDSFKIYMHRLVGGKFRHPVCVPSA